MGWSLAMEEDATRIGVQNWTGRLENKTWPMAPALFGWFPNRMWTVYCFASWTKISTRGLNQETYGFYGSPRLRITILLWSVEVVNSPFWVDNMIFGVSSVVVWCKNIHNLTPWKLAKQQEHLPAFLETLESSSLLGGSQRVNFLGWTSCKISPRIGHFWIEFLGVFSDSNFDDFL